MAKIKLTKRKNAKGNNSVTKKVLRIKREHTPDDAVPDDESDDSAARRDDEDAVYTPIKKRPRRAVSLRKKCQAKENDRK
jgi:hypothetical protein